MPSRYAFLHVDKTAGTSVHRIIRAQGHRAALYPPHWRDKPDTIYARTLDHFIADGTTQLLDDMTAIGGHTDIRLLDHLQAPRFCFTALRDPFDRLVSYYFHYVFREKKTHFRAFREETKGMSFEAFIRFDKLRSEIDNKFCRFFCGTPACETVTADHLAAAKRNLERLDAILFQNALDAGLAEIARALDWRIDEVPRLKVSSTRRTFDGEPPRRAAARPYIQYDEELVQFARDLVAKR